MALELSTGKLVWAFQTVHHDLWDYDNAAPPALVTLRHQGAEIPAVIQATKTGMLFVLHRETGTPSFPVEERAVPPSDVPGEGAAPTQPFTALTPPLSPHRISSDEAWGLGDRDRAECRAAIESLRNEGIFTPPSVRGTLTIPANMGGAHWGGVAVDPVRQIAVVPVNRIASMVQLIPREEFDQARFRAEDGRLGHSYEYNQMMGTPYVMRRRILLGPSGLPCSPPPWGALVAIDLREGGKMWEVPLGSVSRPFPPEVAAQIPKGLGSPNLGGAIVTAGGVVFIAAALDRWWLRIQDRREHRRRKAASCGAPQTRVRRLTTYNQGVLQVMLLSLLLLGNAVLHGIIVGRFGIKGNGPPAAFGILYAGLALAGFLGWAYAALAALVVTTVGLVGLALNFRKLQHDTTVEEIIFVVGAATVSCAAYLLFVR